MTKKQMSDFIEKTGMIVNFNKKSFMQNDKEIIKIFYEKAIDYAKRHNLSC